MTSRARSRWRCGQADGPDILPATAEMMPPEWKRPYGPFRRTVPGMCTLVPAAHMWLANAVSPPSSKTTVFETTLGCATSGSDRYPSVPDRGRLDASGLDTAGVLFRWLNVRLGGCRALRVSPAKIRTFTQTVNAYSPESLPHDRSRLEGRLGHFTICVKRDDAVGAYKLDSSILHFRSLTARFGQLERQRIR